MLQFEVAPAAAGPVKDKLKKLGIVTHHDAQRLQQAEGGTGTRRAEIKSRHQRRAVQRRRSTTSPTSSRAKPTSCRSPAQDVPAEYRKLQDAVTQAKGQVRVGQLNEQDKLNVIAQLDFDVPATARDVDRQARWPGWATCCRATRRGPRPGETATDRKVGYRLTLKNLASIQPRESYVLKVATPDVPAEYRRLQDAIAAGQGPDPRHQPERAGQAQHDGPARLRRAQDGRATPSTRCWRRLGDVLERNTVRAGPTETATDRKVGYRLTLRSLANVAARESYVLHDRHARTCPATIARCRRRSRRPRARSGRST